MPWACVACPLGKEGEAKFVRLFGRRTPGVAPVVFRYPRLHHPHRIRKPHRTVEVQSVARPEQVGESASDRHRRACASPGLCEAERVKEGK